MAFCLRCLPSGFQNKVVYFSAGYSCFSLFNIARRRVQLVGPLVFTLLSRVFLRESMKLSLSLQANQKSIFPAFHRTRDCVAAFTISLHCLLHSIPQSSSSLMLSFRVLVHCTFQEDLVRVLNQNFVRISNSSPAPPLGNPTMFGEDHQTRRSPLVLLSPLSCLSPFLSSK
jgi:hypothetical protein